MMLHFLCGAKYENEPVSTHRDEGIAKDESPVCLLFLRHRSHLGPAGNYLTMILNDTIRPTEGSDQWKKKALLMGGFQSKQDDAVCGEASF